MSQQNSFFTVAESCFIGSFCQPCMTDGNVSEQPAFTCIFGRDHSAEFCCFAHIVDDRSGDQKVPVQHRIKFCDLFCQGSPNLPYYAVGHLYEDLIDAAANQLVSDPDTPLLDIPALVRRLVDTKYRDLWHKKGYIPADWLKYD